VPRSQYLPSPRARTVLQIAVATRFEHRGTLPSPSQTKAYFHNTLFMSRGKPDFFLCLSASVASPSEASALYLDGRLVSVGAAVGASANPVSCGVHLRHGGRNRQGGKKSALLSSLRPVRCRVKTHHDGLVTVRTPESGNVVVHEFPYHPSSIRSFANASHSTCHFLLAQYMIKS
jgi:hypothetical protein